MASCLVALILLLLVAALSRDAGDAGTSGGSDLPSLAGVVTVVAVVGVAVMVITLVAALRGGEGQAGGRRFPRPPIFLVIALVVSMWLPTLYSTREEAPPEEGGTPVQEEAVDDAEGDDRLPASPVLLAVVTALAAGGLVLAHLLRPLEAEEAEEADDGPTGGATSPAGAGRLVAALDEVIDDLRRDPDPRRAVIRAWARLEDLLTDHELPRHPSEAPTRYVGRVLEHLAASRPAVEALTDTFERAMFSPHVIDPGDQVAAVDALVAVRDDLGVSA